MKSFEQIARAMFEAFLKERKSQGSRSTDHSHWANLTPSQQASWIAAAREAAVQLAQVH